MGISKTSRLAWFAGRVSFAALLLLATACFAAPETPDALLHNADQIRTANNAQFQVLLQQLDAQADRLSPLQRDWLAYHKGWQSGLQGDYPTAVAALTAVLDRTQDPTLRARARISLLNDQFNAAHFEEAYANLSVLLDALPLIQDHNAHLLSLSVAGDLYGKAGQFDLALRYTDLALAYDHGDQSTCFELTNKAETLYGSGKLRADNTQIRSGLDACQRVGEPIYANNIRLQLAKAQMDQGDVVGALQSLKAHATELQATHSSASNSQFQAALAKGSLLAGDLAHASEYARSAVDYANKQVNSRASADAWQVLYQVAKQQGDDKGALAYLEKYAAADKGYLNDTSARTLAYQMIHQQVLEKKLQVDALSKQNQVLQLRQTVDRKESEARDLYLVMLLMLLGSIALYAYRTKRSQLKFMKLARRDGLTGIFNRQHFIEASEQALAYGAKSVRDACVIVIDLDHFKEVNDAHGHAAGDIVLKRAVAACQKYMRSLDVFGRLGGEEFGILMPDCVPERAVDVAELMRKEIAGLSESGGDAIDFPIHASFGIAAARWSGYDLRQLLAHADSALYQSKREGRNRVSVYDHATTAAFPPPVIVERRHG